MCEIATLNPVHGSDALYNYAATLYGENQDGLGLVAVYPEGDSYRYETFSQETPDWGDMDDWYEQHSDCWRIVIHARLATTGEPNDQNSHPLKITDDSVDVEWLVHNGIVYGDKQHRARFESEGHEFNTPVDSEVIAHAHGEVPDDIDDLERPGVQGSLNYLLFAENGILVRNDGKYHVTDELDILCTHRSVYEDSHVYHEDNQTGFMLFKPDGSFEQQDINETPGGSMRQATVSGGSWASNRGSSNFNRSYSNHDQATWSGNGSYWTVGEDEADVESDNLADKSKYWVRTDDFKRYDFFCSMHQTLFNEEDGGCPNCAEDGFVPEVEKERIDEQKRNTSRSRYGPYGGGEPYTHSY